MKPYDATSHDFLLYELARPVVFSDTVGTICLPEPGAEFTGQKVIAAGWGRTDGPSISTQQSPVLKAVELTVSRRPYYDHIFMFGTEVKMKDGVYQDPCTGDSGDKIHFVKTLSKHKTTQPNPIL